MSSILSEVMTKDTTIYSLIEKEKSRQKNGVELIPSENYASRHVRQVLGSVLTNKYSEGYPKARYYGGNAVIDDIEICAQKRARDLFNVPFVNVQPYSGSPANFAVLMATCKPGDRTMGMALSAGGHLTHGHFVSASGIFFNSEQYPVMSVRGGKHNDLFDYDLIMKMAKKHEPKLIWVGTTAYPLRLYYEEFAKIADEVNAVLAADISHISGLIVGGAHPSPVPHVHIITTTTHKSLRGPRGAMIMVTEKGIKKDPDLPMKINKAVFPGLQGGPHDNQTAAIAVALYEASKPSFKKYAVSVVENAKVLASELMKHGLKVVADGTDTHLVLVDLTPTHGPGAGPIAEKALDLVHLTLNKNTIPGEQSSPFYPSGIRLGSPAATTRGMKKADMKFIARVMHDVLEITKAYPLPLVTKKEVKPIRPAFIKQAIREISGMKAMKQLRKEVSDRAKRFPIP